MTITPDGKVGIGTIAPQSMLEVVFDNQPGGFGNDFIISRYENSIDWAPITMMRARGTKAAPQNLQSGDRLGGVLNHVKTSSGWLNSSWMGSTYYGDGNTNLSDLWFGTSGTPRMTIDTSGNLILGDNSNGTGTGWGPALFFGSNPGQGGHNTDTIYFQRNNWAADRSSLYLVIGDNGNDVVSDYFVITSGIGEVFNVNSGGNGWIAGGLTQASDRRLKQHIAPLAYGLDAVMKLKPSTFQMKQGDGAIRLGFIAQDVQPVLPELIHNEVQPPGPNAKAGTAPQSYLAMDYVGVIPVLTQSIQELKKEQDKMKQEIALLKAKGEKINPSAPHAEEGAPPSPNAVATPVSPLAPTLWALLGMAVGVMVTYAALRKRA
jgi:hypothetical protein